MITNLSSLKALGRLERDYAGGYREDTRASVQRLASAANRTAGALEGDMEVTSPDEGDEEDTAWPQIVRFGRRGSSAARRY